MDDARWQRLDEALRDFSTQRGMMSFCRVLLGLVVVACKASPPQQPMDTTPEEVPNVRDSCQPREEMRCEHQQGRINPLREAGVGGTLIGSEPWPAACMALAERISPSAIIDIEGKCLVGCDMGEWGGFFGRYEPDAKGIADIGACIHGFVPMAILRVDDDILLLEAHAHRTCAGRVGRLVKVAKTQWSVVEVGDLPSVPLAYTVEPHAIIVELGCASWGVSGAPVGDWGRSRARITAHGVERL